MKIGVVGCGAVGSYYGAMLCRDGQEVHFLLRSDYEVVKRRGVRIRSPQGDVVCRPKCAAVPAAIGVCDLVMIGLKTTANHLFGDLLPPLVGPETAILTLQNGLGNEAGLAALFPREQIMGGLCFVCLNRVAPGVIEHIDHGQVVLGEYQRWPEPRTHDIASMFRHAGISCKVTDNLERTHWEKLMWNIPFNGLGVAGTAGYDAVLTGDIKDLAFRGTCLTTDLLLGDPRWLGLIRELMAEVFRAATGLGLIVSEGLAEKLIDRTRTMGAYRASTLLDFELGRPLELESLFLEPLRQAQQAGMSTPRLGALCRVLTTLASQSPDVAQEN